jgi:GTPase SAR1 family protein
MIGSSGVGKTALLQRLVDDSFSPELQWNVGIHPEYANFEVDGQTRNLGHRRPRTVSIYGQKEAVKRFRKVWIKQLIK